MRALLFAAGLVLALPATAWGSAERPNAFLDAGITLYKNLEYEQALETLKKAESVPGNTVAEELLTNLYMGLILFELGETTAAQSRFKTALALDDGVVLPPSVSPKTEKAFEEARKEIARTKGRPRPQPAPDEPEPPASPEPPVAPEPASPFGGFLLGVRGDVVAFRAAAAGGLTAQYSGRWLGVGLSVLAPAVCVRLEGRFFPVELGPVRPYLAVGATTFFPVTGVRGAVGLEVKVWHLRLFADGAYERYLNADAGHQVDVGLIGGGIGWAF